MQESNAFTEFVKKHEVASLTPGEIIQLDCIMQGMSITEMAKYLFLTEKTIRTTTSKIYGKLGAKSRLELMSSYIMFLEDQLYENTGV